MEAMGLDAASNDSPLSSMSIMLPLTGEPPAAFKCIPDHIFQDILNFVSFIGEHATDALDQSDITDIYIFIVTFISSPKYVYSPHIRAKFGETLFSAFLSSHIRQGDSGRGPPPPRSMYAEKLLHDHPLGQQYLPPALMVLYGDVEATGFYDKLNSRVQIVQLMRHLWTLPSHRASFQRIRYLQYFSAY
jgi:ubiquitin conjugation factor E4 B